MAHMKDLTGNIFNKLTVRWPVGRTPKGSIIWLCTCECGNFVLATPRAIIRGEKKDCGCLRRSKKRPEYKMWLAAKGRAKRKGLPFMITIDDIVIPTTCPLLNIPLYKKKDCAGDNSPSLDRIIPTLGYIPGNVWVISNKANVMKNNATLEELELLVNKLKEKIRG